MKKYLPILRNSPFFKGLTDNEILSILHCVNATTIYRKRCSYIFRAGDSTEVMGLVVSGCVPVSYTHLDVYKRQAYRMVEKTNHISIICGLVAGAVLLLICLYTYYVYQKSKARCV